MWDVVCVCGRGGFCGVRVRGCWVVRKKTIMDLCGGKYSTGYRGTE